MQCLCPPPARAVVRYGRMPDTPHIQFCSQNPRGLAEFDWLIAAGCELRDCLGRCSLCFETRFVVVDETLTIEGEDYAAILAEAARAVNPAPAAPDSAAGA